MGRGGARYVVAGAVFALAATCGSPAGASPLAGWSGAGPGLWHDGQKVVLGAGVAVPIPSYSRQTKLPCNACHTTFPQLTAFGRLFKLNGYTLAGIEQVRATLPDTMAPPTLALDLIPPVSVMTVGSLTHLSEEQPSTQNDNAEFPQQLSIFVGEAITPKIGTFLQVTYSSVDGTLGMDNADLRYADHTTLGSKPMIFGIDANNNPTVQDVWNTVPAWSFPFMSSETAPTPIASPLIFGALGQQVAGVGAYAYWNSLLYVELSGYRSAPQGGPHPADTTATGILSGVTPYWRAALTRQFGNVSGEVGTYGLRARQFPTGIKGATDEYRDIGFDAQLQRETGPTVLALHGTWVGESRTLNASLPAGAASNLVDHVNALRGDLFAFWPKQRLGATVGAFTTTGTTDAALYAPTAVFGSATGSPNSNGFIGELDFNPWLNTRFSAQYILYGKFNGGTTNYDGAGRNASNNNTLYVSAWLVF